MTMFSPGPLSSPELADGYAALQARVTAIARSLTREEAGAMTPCCPEWSVKDTVAHLTGVTTDILEGNTADAATVEWADAQVARRADADLAEVCAEWEANAPKIDEILRAMGDQILPLFYVDAWTHEWDIRQATGSAATPDLTLLGHAWPLMMERLAERNGAPVDAMIDRVDPFTFARVAMGRRSRAQIEALGLDPDVVVAWTPNDVDIVDPVV